MPIQATDLRRCLALLGLAALCALVANALAPAHRRLAWGGWVPPATLDIPATPPPLASTAATATATREAAPTPAGPLAPGPVLGPSKGPAPMAAQTAPVSALQRFPPAADTTSREITSEEAWAAFQLRAPFIDARRSADFTQGHVAGAYSVPVWETDVEKRLTAFEAEANPAPKSPIVIYCGGGGCEDSHLLARKLVSLGYRNLLIYRDGFPDWTGKARPSAQGGRP